MKQLDYQQLLNFCSTNSYINELCADDNLWLALAQRDGVTLLAKFRDQGESWRSFYRRVLYESYYISSQTSFREWTDMAQLYPHVIERISDINSGAIATIYPLSLNEEKKKGFVADLSIIILFRGRTVRGSTHALFSVERTEIKQLPVDPSFYPRLMNPKPSLLFKYFNIFSHDWSYLYDDMTTEAIRLIINKYLDVRRVTENGFGLSILIPHDWPFALGTLSKVKHGRFICDINAGDESLATLLFVDVGSQYNEAGYRIYVLDKLDAAMIYLRIVDETLYESRMSKIIAKLSTPENFANSYSLDQLKELGLLIAQQNR